jgi:hypothetical protein
MASQRQPLAWVRVSRDLEFEGLLRRSAEFLKRRQLYPVKPAKIARRNPLRSR